MKITVRALAPLRPAFLLPLALTALFADAGAALAQQVSFSPGNLVVAVEGCGVYGGTCTVPGGTGTGAGNSALGGYGDNQAAPLTLLQFAPIGTSSATYVSSLVLPQSASGANLSVSGEYGSSSEASLQLSSNGQFLTILGYGVSAAAFNSNPAAYGAAPSLALGQSGSLTGQAYTAVPRVLALIDGRGNVSSSTGIYNVFNTNNPRSAFTQNGTSVYVSGQGVKGDTTQGIFFSPVGTVNQAPTAIDTATDTRTVQIANNTLFFSVDSKQGPTNSISRLGTPGTLPTSSTSASTLPGLSGKITLTAANANNVNSGSIGSQVSLSPVNFFFASPTVLYVADSGNPKSGGLGDGGLQKWVLANGSWQLNYTLYQGLNLVANNTSSGTSGLFGLTGQVVNGQVQLYATSSTVNDLDKTFLYGITDALNATAPAAGESFSVLAAAPSDSNFKGVSFAPTVAPETALSTTSRIVAAGSGYTLTVIVRNTGAATAQDVTLTQVTVGGAAASSLPIDLGPIAAGASASTTLAIPATAGSHGQAVAERLTGSYSGGTFNATTRAQLP